MTISEPMTLITDYVLAAVTAWLCFSLLKHRESQRSRLLWAVAFAALAVGALLGGTWHGFFQNDYLWKATVLTVGVASFAMVAGSAFAALSGAVRHVLIWVAGGKLLTYVYWTPRHDEFIYVVIDSGIAFALVAALHLWRFNAWVVAGVAVSLVAALVQASGFAPHPHFNHNDLYHVIQIAAMVLLYRGARVFRDSQGARASGAPPAPPARRGPSPGAAESPP